MGQVDDFTDDWWLALVLVSDIWYLHLLRTTLRSRLVLPEVLVLLLLGTSIRYLLLLSFVFLLRGSFVVQKFFCFLNELYFVQ